MRKQSVRNCKTVFVVTELRFRAFGHFFINDQLSKEGYCCQEIIFYCLPCNSTLFKERNVGGEKKV